MYQQASVPYNQTCRSEVQTRTCNNGSLSSYTGSFQSTSCRVLAPRSCSSPARDHNQSQTRVRYKDAQVMSDQSCVSETQTSTCVDGTYSAFTGTFAHSSCQVLNPMALFSEARAVLDSKCMNCHGPSTGIAFGPAPGATMEEWYNVFRRGDNLLIAGPNWDDSRLLLRTKLHTKGGSGRTMPSAGTWSQANYDALATWIKSVQVQSVTPGDDPDFPDPVVGNFKLQGYNMPLGERIFVGNLLENLFSTNGNVALNQIYRQMDFFQGGCDIYETARMSNNALEFGNEACSGTQKVSDQIGVSSTVREGRRIMACHLGIYNDTRLNVAISKLGGSNLNTKPNRNNVISALKYFYPNTNFGPDTINLILSKVNQESSSRNAWRAVLFPICASPQWQVL
jgi:hypothetical protein